MVDLAFPYRRARPDDARELAYLIDRAGEGIPMYLWGRVAEPGQNPLEIGMARAQRSEGGFSYTNAIVYEHDGRAVALLLGYRLDDPYELGDLTQVPDVVVPMLELESKAPGSWYVNALAVAAGFEGRGIAWALLGIAEDLCRETGATNLSLIAAAQNARARRVYESLGYRERERRPVVPFAGFAYAGDWVLMVTPAAVAT